MPAWMRYSEPRAEVCSGISATWNSANTTLSYGCLGSSEYNVSMSCKLRFLFWLFPIAGLCVHTVWQAVWYIRGCKDARWYIGFIGQASLQSRFERIITFIYSDNTNMIYVYDMILFLYWGYSRFFGLNQLTFERADLEIVEGGLGVWYLPMNYFWVLCWAGHLNTPHLTLHWSPGKTKPGRIWSHVVSRNTSTYIREERSIYLINIHRPY